MRTLALEPINTRFRRSNENKLAFIDHQTKRDYERKKEWAKKLIIELYERQEMER